MQGRLRSRLILLLFFFLTKARPRGTLIAAAIMKASPFETFFDSPLLSVSFNVQIVCTTLQIKQTNRLHYVYVHVRRFGFQNPGNICLWNPDSIIQLKESGILLEIGIQNPNPTDKEWNPVPGIQNSRLSWILSHRAKHNLSFNS